MRSPSLLALVAVAVLSVAGCGGGTTTPTSAATATAAPGGATASPVASTAPGGATASPAPSTVPGGASASTGIVDPCSLLNQADIKAATGKDYGAGVADAYGQCTWLAGTATVNNGSGQIVATVQDQQLSFIKSSFAGGFDVTVGGHAGYWNPTSGLQSIWVDLGGRVLVLSFDPVGPETQAVAQALAAIAVSHT